MEIYIKILFCIFLNNSIILYSILFIYDLINNKVVTFNLKYSMIIIF